MPPASLNIFHQPLHQQRLERRRSHLGIKRHHVGSLRPRANFPRILDVLFLERRPDALRNLVIVPGIRLSPRRPGHIPHHVRNQRPIRRRQQILVRIRIRRQPVGKIRPHSLLAKKSRITLLNKTQPVLHRLPIVGDDRRIPILQPCRPRHNHASIAPARRAHISFRPRSRALRTLPAERQRIRRHIRKRALGSLRIHYVLNKFLRERGHIIVVGARPPEHTRIPHPPQPLVALRTIGRNAQIIPPLPPSPNRPHLIHQLTRRRQLPRRLSIHAADHFAS